MWMWMRKCKNKPKWLSTGVQIAQFSKHYLYLSDPILIWKIWNHQCDRLIESIENGIDRFPIRGSDCSEISEEASGTRNLSE